MYPGRPQQFGYGAPAGYSQQGYGVPMRPAYVNAQPGVQPPYINARPGVHPMQMSLGGPHLAGTQQMASSQRHSVLLAGTQQLVHPAGTQQLVHPAGTQQLRVSSQPKVYEVPKFKRQSSSNKLELGYWNIRGRGAAIRMVLEYMEEDYTDTQINSDAENSAGAQWFTETKPVMLKSNAYASLPYLLDGDKVISQSNAILLYLGRKFNLLGANDLEQTYNEQTMFQAEDAVVDYLKVIYGTGNTDPDFAEKAATWISTGCKKWCDSFNLWLVQHRFQYFSCNDRPLVADFLVFEFCNQQAEFAKSFGIPCPIERCAALHAWWRRMSGIPEIQKYLEDADALRYNAPFAAWSGPEKLKRFSTCVDELDTNQEDDKTSEIDQTDDKTSDIDEANAEQESDK